MGFHDILLSLDTYPDPTGTQAVDQAMRLCAKLGGKVTALAMPVDLPVRTNPLAESVMHLSQLASDLETASQENASKLMAQVCDSALRHGVTFEALAPKTNLYDMPDHLAHLARTRDLTVIPYGEDCSAARCLVEAAVFGSGRPVLAFRPYARPIEKLDRIAIAWDGGRPAARAVADALPLLKAAEKVRILSVLNDKPQVAFGETEDLVRHLRAHGVEATADELDRGDRQVDQVISSYMEYHQIDLLVMGAFGHSRLREFVLGGVTENIIARPPIPVLLSH